MINKKLQKNFTIADNRIMQCDKLSFEARGMYFYILSLPDDWDFSEERLAKNGNMSVCKCKRILKELFKIGLLRRDFTNNEKGYRKAIYTLFDFSMLENPMLENPMLENRTNNKEINNNKELLFNKEKNKQKEHEAFSASAQSLFTSENKENLTAPKQNAQTENYIIEFNKLWDEYPNKQGKQLALNSYINARKGMKKRNLLPASYETIIKGVRTYLKANQGTEIKYIKHLSTFLNQGTHFEFQSEMNLNRRVSVVDNNDDYINANKSKYIPK